MRSNVKVYLQDYNGWYLSNPASVCNQTWLVDALYWPPWYSGVKGQMRSNVKVYLQDSITVDNFPTLHHSDCDQTWLVDALYWPPWECAQVGETHYGYRLVLYDLYITRFQVCISLLHAYNMYFWCREINKWIEMWWFLSNVPLWLFIESQYVFTSILFMYADTCSQFTVISGRVSKNCFSFTDDAYLGPNQDKEKDVCVFVCVCVCVWGGGGVVNPKQTGWWAKQKFGGKKSRWARVHIGYCTVYYFKNLFLFMQALKSP